MNVIDIIVDKDVNYLTNWKDAQMRPFELPNGILDKGIPNCGATTLALTDSHKTIVCSKRLFTEYRDPEDFGFLRLVAKGGTLYKR